MSGSRRATLTPSRPIMQALLDALRARHVPASPSTEIIMAPDLESVTDVAPNYQVVPASIHNDTGRVFSGEVEASPERPLAPALCTC